MLLLKLSIAMLKIAPKHAGALADLRLPGALEAIDEIVADIDGGALTASAAIERLLSTQISLRITPAGDRNALLMSAGYQAAFRCRAALDEGFHLPQQSQPSQPKRRSI